MAQAPSISVEVKVAPWANAVAWLSHKLLSSYCNAHVGSFIARHGIYIRVGGEGYPWVQGGRLMQRRCRVRFHYRSIGKGVLL
jgi:hypothetical protein